MADEYYIVKKGDTLSAIARMYNTTYQKLAEINNISNPHLIFIGQKIKVTGSASTTSSPGSTATSLKAPTIVSFGLQSNTEKTIFVTWYWDKRADTESYKVEWSYKTNGFRYIERTSTITVDPDNYEASQQATCDIPDKVKDAFYVRIKPVPKKDKDKNGNETERFQANWTDYKEYLVSDLPLEALSTAPALTMKNNDLIAEYENLETEATHINFQLFKNDIYIQSRDIKNAALSATKSVSVTWNAVSLGAKYKVRAQAVLGSKTSEWSPFSNAIGTIPEAPAGITTCRANSETSVYLAWSSCTTAIGYEIEYTNKRTNFDTTNDTSRVTTELTTFEITGLETGTEYFFRVRAINDEGESGWTAIASTVIGKEPAAPTTWSSTTTAITGEELILYWVHNSEDGSSQTYAELEYIVNGRTYTQTIANSTDEDEKDKTSFYKLDTSSYVEGSLIQWRVRTAGVLKDAYGNVKYGEWSIQRAIDVYAQPSIQMSLKNQNGQEVNVLTSFPMYVTTSTSPATQSPVSYHLAVISNDTYDTVDEMGNIKTVSKGDSVYSKYFDTSERLTVSLSADNINLDNGMSYKVECTVSMNSGLTASTSCTFTVAWLDEMFAPNAEITFDRNNFTAQVHPYCESRRDAYYTITKTGRQYARTDTEIQGVLDGVFTTTGEKVYLGASVNGTELYYCAVMPDNFSSVKYYIVNYSNGSYVTSNTTIAKQSIYHRYTTDGYQVYLGILENGSEVYYTVAEVRTPIAGITLSVYRREFDGGFTELATDIDNSKNIFVSDPHPALDYARYRIVAKSESTGAISYYDVPGYYVGEKAVIIQWDETWTDFDITEDAQLADKPWTGSLLKLPYNIDISNENSSDVVFKEYQGRKHPVSYYGTQLGEKANWSVEIDANDKDALYALRRLSIWMGNVYVREPSGTGYWASIKVSYSQTHCQLTIPVTLEITRVEGGM